MPSTKSLVQLTGNQTDDGVAGMLRNIVDLANEAYVSAEASLPEQRKAALKGQRAHDRLIQPDRSRRRRRVRRLSGAGTSSSRATTSVPAPALVRCSTFSAEPSPALRFSLLECRPGYNHLTLCVYCAIARARTHCQGAQHGIDGWPDRPRNRVPVAASVPPSPPAGVRRRLVAAVARTAEPDPRFEGSLADTVAGNGPRVGRDRRRR